MSPKEPKVGAKKHSGPSPAKGKPPQGRPPWLPILLAGALAVVGIAAAIVLQPPPPTEQSADIGGPFQMIDASGRPVDQTILNGKWSAVFFGYTFCPDICPATLTALAAAQSKLPKGAELQTVFVTIDPARDTPAQLKTYVNLPAFPRPIIGLTGTDAQVAAMAKAYKVYYARGAGEGAGYLMDHNSAIYLMDPKGRFAALIRPDNGPEGMAAAVSAAMDGR